MSTLHELINKHNEMEKQSAQTSNQMAGEEAKKRASGVLSKDILSNKNSKFNVADIVRGNNKLDQAVTDADSKTTNTNTKKNLPIGDSKISLGDRAGLAASRIKKGVGSFFGGLKKKVSDKIQDHKDYRQKEKNRIEEGKLLSNPETRVEGEKMQANRLLKDNTPVTKVTADAIEKKQLTDVPVTRENPDATGNSPLTRYTDHTQEPKKVNMRDLKDGSQERIDEYKRRGWALDETTGAAKPGMPPKNHPSNVLQGVIDNSKNTPKSATDFFGSGNEGVTAEEFSTTANPSLKSETKDPNADMLAYEKTDEYQKNKDRTKQNLVNTENANQNQVRQNDFNAEFGESGGKKPELANNVPSKTTLDAQFPYGKNKTVASTYNKTQFGPQFQKNSAVNEAFMNEFLKLTSLKGTQEDK
ncbi:hypothetical protein H8D85_01500 [bacterium]|nr:hypothetical protein [bacterium]